VSRPRRERFPEPERLEGPQVGEVHPVRIDATTPDGAGRCRLEEIELIVGGTAVGDEVSARLVHRTANRAFAEPIEVHARGPESREAPCAQAEYAGGRCGGCALQHLRPEVQRRHKADWAWMDGCVIVRPELERTRAEIAALVRAHALPVHRHPGPGLRWVSLRSGARGEVLVELIVSGGEAVPDEFLDAITRIDGVAGVWASRNDAEGNAIRVEHAVHVRGTREVVEEIAGLCVPLGPATFFQLHTAVAEAMFEQAAAWLGEGGLLCELYAGVGVGGTAWALRGEARRVIGFEANAESVGIARRVGAALHERGAWHVWDLARAAPPELAGASAVLANPPRRGLDAPVLTGLGATAAQTLVYMSCSPESLARDLAHLQRAGWRVTDLGAWDMLPRTRHVELLARLER
jgi:tRNA/tmRNA/rRNA uracil-C5-methylase (TrmA/RlmC/RlmD family)